MVFWLVIQQLAADFNLSNYLAWANSSSNSSTLFIGVWLSPDEGEGPNNGHIATVGPDNRTVHILDDTRLSANRPAMAPDGWGVAFDVFSNSPDDMVTSRLYHPDTVLQRFDPAAFAAGNTLIDGPRFNPAWSPDGRRIAWLASTGERVGVQVFDLDRQTVVQLYDWDPARFGATIPSPVWSSDGEWLALEIWANGPVGSGIWLLGADGGSQTLLDAQGHDPFWANESQLVFGVNGGPRLYDVPTDQMFRIDLPEDSWLLGVTSMAEMLTLPEYFTVVEPPKVLITTLQEVPIYNGPNDSYHQIGTILGGQAVQITGQSYVTGWWRVICPDDSVGNCFITTDPDHITVVDNPNP